MVGRSIFWDGIWGYIDLLGYVVIVKVDDPNPRSSPNLPPYRHVLGCRARDTASIPLSAHLMANMARHMPDQWCKMVGLESRVVLCR